MGSISNAELEAKIALLSEALRKADERATAGQLALEMIHDIRNPLEALANLLYLSELELEADNGVALRQYLGLAREQIDTVTKIASQTLSFAKSVHSAQVSNLGRMNRLREGKCLARNLGHRVNLLPGQPKILA